MPVTLLAEIDSTAYNITKFLHVLAAIVGFGAVFFNGLYGRKAKAAGEAGRPQAAVGITDANVAVSGVAEWFIYAVPLFGIGLVFMSDDVIGFGETWIWLALVVYAVGLAVSLTFVQPTARRILKLSEELAEAGPPPEGAQGPPPQVAQLDRLGSRIGAASGVAHLIMAIALALMVWKPGAQGVI